MKAYSLKCPHCNAQLQIDTNLEVCYCQYCGTKILLHNENKKEVTINYNIKDEAKMLAEERKLKEKILDLEKQKEKNKDFYITMGFMVFIMILCFCFSLAYKFIL